MIEFKDIVMIVFGTAFALLVLWLKLLIFREVFRKKTDK